MRIKKTLAALGILLGAAGGTAWAAGTIGSIVAPDGTIKGCYQINNGQLRVVAAAETCRDSERPLSWAQQGPQGQRGPEGPPGPAGAGGSPLPIDSLTCTKRIERGDRTYASFPGTVHAEDSGQLLLACIATRHRVTLLPAPEVAVLFSFEVEGTGVLQCGGCELQALEGTAIITQQHPSDAAAPPRTWGGACRGQIGDTCTLEVDGDKLVTVE